MLSVWLPALAGKRQNENVCPEPAQKIAKTNGNNLDIKMYFSPRI
jgi:hypothetical protein